jgi:hypothetical protein
LSGTKRILLISALPEDHAFAKVVAATAECTLQVVPAPVDAVKILTEGGCDIVFVDASSEAHYRAFEQMVQETIGLFSDKINANAIHFISQEDLERVQYLVASPLFGHFIIRNYGDPNASGEHYGRVLKATLAERAFGLAPLMGAQAKVQTVKFMVSNQKQNAVEAVKNYLLAAKFQSRMATVVANAVDELLMNAMFDAPVDELGRQLLASTPRATALKLEGRHAVEMQVGYDGRFVGIQVIDLFGSLDKLKLLTHISKIYTDEEYKVKTTIAGAGIGLATVFRSGGSFFFVSEGQLRTEVTVFFRKTDNFREFKDQFRFISTQFYF